MAALLAGIERTLTDMERSTELAYRIKENFYVISQPANCKSHPTRIHDIALIRDSAAVVGS